jgi:hypothetical protein
MNCKKIISPMMVALLIVVNLSTSCISFSQSAVNEQNSQQNSNVEAIEKPVIPNETELERNKRTWTDSKIKNYKITLESDIANALYPTLSPVEIEVREGKTFSIRHLAKDKKPVSMAKAKNDFGLMGYESRGVDTIEAMFDLIKRAEEGKTRERLKTILLEVEYDPKYGYPTKINYDVAATDSHIYVQVKKFEIIE